MSTCSCEDSLRGRADGRAETRLGSPRTQSRTPQQTHTCLVDTGWAEVLGVHTQAVPRAACTEWPVVWQTHTMSYAGPQRQRWGGILARSEQTPQIFLPHLQID